MFGAGIVVGYSPMLAMLAFVHGFGQAFVGSFSAYLRDQSLPLFWTWTELSNRASFVISVKLVALGCLHILAPAMCAYLFVCLVRDARSGASTPPVVAGAAFVGTIYLHYVFSRADIRHFAQGVAPLLVGWAALAAALRGGPRRRCVATVAGCFVLLTCVSVLLERPVARYWMDRKHYRTVAVGNRELIVPPMV